MGESSPGYAGCLTRLAVLFYLRASISSPWIISLLDTRPSHSFITSSQSIGILGIKQSLLGANFEAIAHTNKEKKKKNYLSQPTKTLIQRSIAMGLSSTCEQLSDQESMSS